MPTFCIIGGAGRTGQLLLQNLASSGENQVRVYVRNKAKLEKLFPKLVSQDNLSVFEGSIKDVDLLQQCIGTSNTLFLVTAPADNDPMNTVLYDTAHTVVTALRRRQQKNEEAQSPHIVVLSTATINPTFNQYTPRIVQFLLTTALNNKYKAFRQTEDYLQLQHDWIKLTFVQPGGMVEDSAQGYRLSLHDTKTFLSFADLALGMIEIAQDSQLYEGKFVSVVPTGSAVKKNLGVPAILLKGYLWRFFPRLYAMVRRIQQRRR